MIEKGGEGAKLPGPHGPKLVKGSMTKPMAIDVQWGGHFVKC